MPWKNPQHILILARAPPSPPRVAKDRELSRVFVNVDNKHQVTLAVRE